MQLLCAVSYTGIKHKKCALMYNNNMIMHLLVSVCVTICLCQHLLNHRAVFNKKLTGGNH